MTITINDAGAWVCSIGMVCCTVLFIFIGIVVSFSGKESK